VSFSISALFAWRIAHSPVKVLTNDYSTLYTPPIFCVKYIQAETIIAVVKSVYWGWLKSNLSEIAAVRQFLDMIVKAFTGEWAILQANRLSNETLSFSGLSNFCVKSA